MWYVLLLINFATAEIITLARQKDIACVISGDSVNSPVYLNPPTKSGFIKDSAEFNNWIADDWTMVNSLDTRQTAVTDKRWEGFTMLHQDSGYALENNSLPFSVCVTGNFSLDVLSSNYINEKWITITPPHLNVQRNNNSCKWIHYTLTKQGTLIDLRSAESVQTFDMGFDPYWVFIKSPTANTTFWKLHDYKFRSAATTTTKGKESKLSVNFIDNLCLSMYVSVDKNSYLDVILETSNNVINKTIIGFNVQDDLKKWQRIEIEASSYGEGNISFFRGLITQQRDQVGYWAIDKISFCNKHTEVLRASVEGEASGEYVCESLNQDQITKNTNENVLKCNKPGFLGDNCIIDCSTALGSDYSYCENHKICQSASSCFCSWGYQGEECNQPCLNGKWGLFCSESCNQNCSEKCHVSTGECFDLDPAPEEIVERIASNEKNLPLTASFATKENLRQEENVAKKIRLIEQDLPLNITISTNEITISLPHFDKDVSNISYYIKYICVSNWCKDQVMENYTVINIPSQNFVRHKFKNFIPLTEYQAVVTVQRFNQSLEKRYDIVKIDGVYAIEDLSIFNRNSSSLWIRFGDSKVPNVGRLQTYNVWYQGEFPESSPKSTESVFRCTLWDNYMCARIDNLKRATVYNIMVVTQYQQYGLSKIVHGNTTEEEPRAPENLKVRWSSDGKAMVSWKHPTITHGSINKFVLKIQTKETVNIFTVNVTEPQKTYSYKFPVEYRSQYTISVRGFNKYEEDERIITAIFIPFTSSFSSNGTIIEMCTNTGACFILVPKPEDLQYKGIYRILAIQRNNTSTNIQELLNNKVEPSEQGWLTLEDTGLDEQYFTADIGTQSAKIFSIQNIQNYSLYFIQNENNNDSIDHAQIPEEKILESDPIITSGITSITVLSVLLTILLLLMLLLTFHRNHFKKNNSNQEFYALEQNSLITEDETQKQFTRIETRFLEKYLNSALLTGKDLIQQFRSLPTATKPMVHAFNPKNKNKNKDNENIPYDHNRVILEKMHGMGSDDYINASYIDGLDHPKTYIATQGPKFYTIRDFWRLIWQEQVKTIIMATNFMENKKRKCAEYFPQKLDAIFECGQMMIKLIKEEFYEHHTVRFMEVCYKRSVRNIQHFHLKWSPDNFRPLYPNCIVPLIKTIGAIREKSNAPILIHCSSGSNRTGTLILCDLALHMANSNDGVDFYSLLKKLRDQRPNMICSEKQYILAHLVVLECLMEQENIFKKSLRENFHSSIFKSQLEFVKRLSWHDEIVQNFTPRLSCLNNSYLIYPVDGYATDKKFVTTQIPSNKLIDRFWDMIIQENIELIVLIDQDRNEIWPYQRHNNNTLLTVKKLQSWRSNYCIYTKVSLLVFALPSNTIIHEQIIVIFEVNNSDVKNTNGFLNVLDDINKSHYYYKQKPILVACHDGVRKSGLFVTLDYIIQKCKKEFDVDVCNGIRNVRRSGLPFVKTPVEIELLYRTSLDYLQQFDEYACIL